MAVALAACIINKREAIFAETDASQHQYDASDADQLASLFADLDHTIRTPDMELYNPSARVPGSSQDLDAHSTKKALNATCYGAFLVTLQAAKRMRQQGARSILFNGASA